MSEPEQERKPRLRDPAAIPIVAVLAAAIAVPAFNTIKAEVSGGSTNRRSQSKAALVRALLGREAVALAQAAKKEFGPLPKDLLKPEGPKGVKGPDVPVPNSEFTYHLPGREDKLTIDVGVDSSGNIHPPTVQEIIAGDANAMSGQGTSVGIKSDISGVWWIDEHRGSRLVATTLGESPDMQLQTARVLLPLIDRRAKLAITPVHDGIPDLA